MVLPLLDLVNRRSSGAEQVLSETYLIGEDDANWVYLREAPLQAYGVTIAGYTAVTTTPAVLEFRVVYSGRLMGAIEFNAANNGALVTIAYKGRGSPLHARDVNRIHDAIRERGYSLADFGRLSDAHFTNTVIAAVASGEKDIYVPPGTYNHEDGAGWELSNNLTIRGAGRQRTFIRTKDQYAFYTPATGATGLIRISGFSFQLRAGSTSGGAIKAVSDFYHSQWLLEELYSDGDYDSEDPLFHLSGWIGCLVRLVQAQICQTGIFLDGATFAANASTLRDFRVSQAQTTGVHVKGALQRVFDGILENCTGPAVWVDASPSAIIGRNWFENNGGTGPAILVSGTSTAARIEGNNFFYHQSGDNPHILLQGPDSPASLSAVDIEGNRFGDPSPAGYDVQITENVDGTTIRNNRLVGDAMNTQLILDGGTGTQPFGNTYGDDSILSNSVLGRWKATSQPYYGNQRATFDIQAIEGQTEPFLNFRDADGDVIGFLTASLRLLLGGTSLDAAAILQLNSTTQGLLFPRMTTTQKNAISTPPAGLVIYDATLNKLQVRTDSAWESLH